MNIGIVCANAPVLRPLYLFFQGRLASQKISRIAATSKGDASWPSDTTRIERVSPSWKNQMSDGGASMEMGLTGFDTVHSKDFPEDPQLGPRNERSYFVAE